jgi:hypothetical protein
MRSATTLFGSRARRGCQRFGPGLRDEKTTLVDEVNTRARRSERERRETLSLFAHDAGRNSSVDVRETHPGAGTRVTFGEAVVDFDASRAVGADESQGSAGHAAIVRENFHSDRFDRSKRADAGAEGAEDETVREERVRVQFESPRYDTRSRRPCSKYDDRRLESFQCAPNPGVRRATLVRRVNRFRRFGERRKSRVDSKEKQLRRRFF